eukprot:TCONS_00055342-protein
MVKFSKEKVLESAEELVKFVNGSPSPYHAVDQCIQRLDASGFQRLDERHSWELAKGGKYYLTRNDSTIFAFAVGKKFVTGNGVSMVGAHTDSPCFKLKPKSKQESEGCLLVGTQCYGGGIWHTWFDRDLGAAGQVIVETEEGKYESKLFRIDDPILRVPNICIHLNRTMNDNHSVNKETQTPAVLATKCIDEEMNEFVNSDENTAAGKHHGAFIERICSVLSCKPEQIIDFDICLADTQPAAIGGVHKEFIFSPRLDNLFNAYTSLQALINSCVDQKSLDDETNIRMIALYDNEEVGSQSAQGAGSAVTEWVLRRICQCFGGAFEQTIANSYLLSVDQAHAVHPNYAAKHENNHKPQLHKGIVIKTNANQRYATTAITGSIIRLIAKKCGVPLQDVVVRNDSTCGSTIGPIMSAKLGVRTLDMGGPMLSMHSIREQCCTTSVQQGVTLFHAFFEEFPGIDRNLSAN